MCQLICSLEVFCGASLATGLLLLTWFAMNDRKNKRCTGSRNLLSILQTVHFSGQKNEGKGVRLPSAEKK